METILYNIGQVLGITIIHSLWQGLILYIVLRTVFVAAPGLSSFKKYNAAVAAIGAMSVWFIYTLCAEFSAYNWVSLNSIQAVQLGKSGEVNQFTVPLHQTYNFGAIAAYLPYVSVVYIIGVAANLAKLSWEWNKIRHIKRSFIPAGQMQQHINKFSKKLNITKNIQLKFSNVINVPCTIGFLKPIILLPVSLATYLSACEIEAILLHELSHIKRNDYLINLLQQVIAVILFFNPFAQLIHRIINVERENGCDDLVVEKTGKPLIYAQALLKLEENRATQLSLALAATGNKNYLLKRIERIMKTKKPIKNIRHLLVATLLLAVGLSTVAWFNPEFASAKNHTKTVKPAKETHPAKSVATSFIAATDSTKSIRVSDTVKHHKKYIVVDENGNKKEYTMPDSLAKPEFNFDQSFDFKNNWPGTDSLNKFYSGDEWKKQMAVIKKQSEALSKQMNSQAWKNQMEAMTRQSEKMAKHFDSQVWKNQMEQMKKQFDSPQWKAQMEQMSKQFDSPEWKHQMEAMTQQSEKMAKQFDSREFKHQMEQMTKQFNSPEWKKQVEQMKKQGEEMGKQFNSPEWKKAMKEMKFNFNDSTNFNFNDSDSTVRIYKQKTQKHLKKTKN